MTVRSLKTMLQLTRTFCWRRKKTTMADEREMRLQRLHAVREQGINPYPNRVKRTHTISEILQHFDEWQGPEGAFTVTGRNRLMRDMVKGALVNIVDAAGRMHG